jgi:hypothetical protein
MNLTSKVCAVAALAVACSTASAQSAPLAVTGNIVPAGCVPTLSTSVFDYKDISGDKLQTINYTPLEEKTAVMSIACGGPRQVAFQALDSRYYTVPQDLSGVTYVYGLGAARGKDLGYYQITMSDFQIDGKSANAIYSNNSGVDWRASGPTQALIPTSAKWFSMADPLVPGTPAAGTTYSTTLTLQTYIAPKNALDMTGTSDLDGAATIVLHYL